MTTADISPSSGRPYDNRRRAAQAAENRARVVDAAVALLAEGAEELTVPQIAARAGVSVPTVYRNFPTRDDLLAAVDGALLRSLGTPPRYETLSELIDGLSALHTLFGQNAAVIRAAAHRPALAEVRDAGRRSRDRDFEVLLADVSSKLPAEDARALAALVRVLGGTETFLILHDRFGLHPGTTGRAIAWAIERLTAAARDATALAPAAGASA